MVISSLGIAGAKNSAIHSSFYGEGIQFFAQWKGLQNNPSFRLHVDNTFQENWWKSTEPGRATMFHKNLKRGTGEVISVDKKHPKE